MAEEEISLQETEDLGVTDKENPEVVIEGEDFCEDVFDAFVFKG